MSGVVCLWTNTLDCFDLFQIQIFFIPMMASLNSCSVYANLKPLSVVVLKSNWSHEEITGFDEELRSFWPILTGLGLLCLGIWSDFLWISSCLFSWTTRALNFSFVLQEQLQAPVEDCRWLEKLFCNTLVDSFSWPTGDLRVNTLCMSSHWQQWQKPGNIQWVEKIGRPISETFLGHFCLCLQTFSSSLRQTSSHRHTSGTYQLKTASHLMGWSLLMHVFETPGPGWPTQLN